MGSPWSSCFMFIALFPTKICLFATEIVSLRCFIDNN